MRLDRLKVTNFNCFAERELTLAQRFNLIVGDNATGKTSLLNAMAVGVGSLFLGFPSPATPRSIDADEVRLGTFIHGNEFTQETQFPVQVECHGEINGNPCGWMRELTCKTGKTTRQDAAQIFKISKELNVQVTSGQSVCLPVISFYGTGRLWFQKRQRTVTTLKPDSRFMGYLDCLDPASDEKRLLQWFKTQEIDSLQHDRRSETLEACRLAIQACIPEAERVYFDVKRDQLIIQFPDRFLPFHYLSDGFRNMLGMVADIAVRCTTLNPHLGQIAPTQTPGVVLIDEIDLHLHPKWQRRVVNDLMRCFPKIQFVGTTHSPFIIQSLPPTDVVKLINLDNPVANDFSNKSVEDISEEVQGVELPQRSHRWLEMMSTAEQYYALLRSAKEIPAEEIEKLRRHLDELSLPFSDDPAYQALLRSQRAATGIDQEGA